MNPVHEKLIRLHDSPSMTRPLLRRIIKMDPALEDFFMLTPEQMSSLYRLPIARTRSIYQHIHSTNIRKKLDNFFKKYTILTWFDSSYPELLRMIPDPPLVLYLQGNAQLLSCSPSLSVVGTRTPSRDALPAMKRILTPALLKEMTIVSGMAKGIDQYAHRLAIEEGGRTIAVLGSGFQHIYPRNDLSLYYEISENHLALSEYPPDRSPKKYHFPERNRIISGLSPSLFVVEARLRSGSLITVDQALEQGREVYAMPGRPCSPTSEGCHQMINEGAKLVHSARDLFEW